jgi:hypothetical protein
MVVRIYVAWFRYPLVVELVEINRTSVPALLPKESQLSMRVNVNQYEMAPPAVSALFPEGVVG